VHIVLFRAEWCFFYINCFFIAFLSSVPAIFAVQKPF
jgi:hypothetical protein